MADLNDTLSATASFKEISVEKSAPVLDDALRQTRDFLQSLQKYQKEHEDFERKAAKELKHHSQIKEKCKTAEVEHERVRVAHDEEVKAHTTTRSKVEELEKGSLKLQEDLKAVTEDLSAVRVENEALRVEMEAKRQAFVVNLNLAGRHAELRAKHDEKKEECGRLRTEHANLQEVLQAAHTRLAKVADLEEQIQRDVVAKMRGKQRAMYALERSLGKNDESLVASLYHAWSCHLQDIKKSRMRKDQSMQRGMRAIANSNAALMQIVFNDWFRAKEEQKRGNLMDEKGRLQAAHGSAGAAAARAREKAMAQLEKQWGASDKRLKQQVIDGIKQVRAARLRRDKSKAGALRGIAASDEATKATVMGSWGKLTRDSRAQREKKDQSMAKAMKMVGSQESIIKGTIVNMWQRLTRSTKEEQAKKNDGNSKAMRMIANSGQALVAAVFHCWNSCVRKEKEKANKLKVVERNLVSAGQGMLAYVLHNWAKYTNGRSTMRKKKDQNMQRALKNINGSNVALQDTVLQLWLRVVEKAKQDRLVEEGKKAKEHIKRAQEAGEALAKAGEEKNKISSEVEELRRLRCEERPRLLQAESKIDELTRHIELRERQLIEANQELHESRMKAAHIAEELTKVGAFIMQTPRRRSRPGSGLRAASTQDLDKENSAALPKIDSRSNGARPPSGRGSSRHAWGSETAR